MTSSGDNQPSVQTGVRVKVKDSAAVVVGGASGIGAGDRSTAGGAENGW
jgi:hypothetical protein